MGDDVLVLDRDDVALPDLADVRLTALIDGGSGNTTTLDAVMRRLFDPRERDLLTVSAFSSAL